MRLLGCDPGYRHFGVVLVETNGEGKPKVLRRATLKGGSIKNWQNEIHLLLDKLGEFLKPYQNPIDAVGVEMISWYGKRRGSLQLAHLAGATLGFLKANPNVDSVRFFIPKEVKAMSAQFPGPKGFDEHQTDALSLCRLLVASGS